MYIFEGKKRFKFTHEEDKRMKLTKEQREEILSLKNKKTALELSNIYNVTKTTIFNIWNGIKSRQDWRKKYNKEKHRIYMARYRKHKKEVYLKQLSVNQ